MLNSLDLLIIAAMILATAGILSLALMFLLKNKTAQRVCFYLAVALGVYLGTVGARINWPGFGFQVMLAVVYALVCVAALVLERVKKGDEQTFKHARIMAALGVAAGMANAFFV